MERICEYDLEMKKDSRKPMLRISRELEYMDVDRNLNTGSMVVGFFKENYNLHLKSEEYVYLMATDTKCHILGVMQIAHGTVDHALVGRREIAIRMLLLGAVKTKQRGLYVYWCDRWDVSMHRVEIVRPYNYWERFLFFNV